MVVAEQLMANQPIKYALLTTHILPTTFIFKTVDTFPINHVALIVLINLGGPE